MASVSSLSVWNEFFLSAGIPETVAHEYAVTFSQHRIRIDMLKEITKEILLDMGIKAMGDIIAILRHAKDLYTQDELKGGFKNTTPIASNLAINLKGSGQALTSQTQRIQSSAVARTGLSLTSSTKSKIHSRLGLQSNGLITDSSNLSHETGSVTNSNKRIASTTSVSLTKRLRANPEQTSTGGISLPEKTLTVHYPSGSAIVRAQQRLHATPGSSRGTTSQPVGSIKSRLGAALKDSPISRPSELPSSNSNGNSRNINHFHRNRQEPMNNSAHTKIKNRYDPNPNQESSSRERVKSQPGRLKSTVFNRLGDPAR